MKEEESVAWDRLLELSTGDENNLEHLSEETQHVYTYIHIYIYTYIYIYRRNIHRHTHTHLYDVRIKMYQHDLGRGSCILWAKYDWYQIQAAKCFSPLFLPSCLLHVIIDYSKSQKGSEEALDSTALCISLYDRYAIDGTTIDVPLV